MNLVTSSIVSALALAATASASTNRHLQDSLVCLVSGTDPETCCASATGADQICGLLTCVDTETLTLVEDDDGCSCSTLSDFCTTLGTNLAAIYPDVTPLCTAVQDCCQADTTNSDFNSCFEGKGVDVSNLVGMLGGGAANGTDAAAAGDLSSLTGGMSMPTDLGSATDLLESLTGATAPADAEAAADLFGSLTGTGGDAGEESGAEEEAPAPSPAESESSGAMYYGTVIAVLAATSAMMIL